MALGVLRALGVADREVISLTHWVSASIRSSGSSWRAGIDLQVEQNFFNRLYAIGISKTKSLTVIIWRCSHANTVTAAARPVEK
jgi:hypothetical protein